MSSKYDLNEQVKQALDESARALPEHVEIKLQQARKKALNAANQSSANWSKTFVALAACISLIVPLWLGFSSHNTEDMVEIQSLDLMVSLAEIDEEEWELVDDLEFALWLNEQAVVPKDIKFS